MNFPHKNIFRIAHWIVVLSIPVFVGFGIIILSITPLYPRYEYAKESFPPDNYGWTQEQRLELALVAVAYLRRPEPAEEVIFMLEEQRLPGSDEPLYNEEEISHMIDVKLVADGLIERASLIAGAIAILGLIVLFWQPETRLLGYRAVRRGGMVLTLLLVGIGLFILIGWNTFFTLFHELLFPPDTWSFPLTDSLIRLFPNKFWFDYGTLTSGAVFVSGVIIWLLGAYLVRRHKQSG